MNENKFLCVVLQKHKVNLFYMEAKILDINKQSSNANFNVVFLQNYT